MKSSNYTIYIHVPESDEYYLVHGYSGAVDKVSPDVVSYLLDHGDPDHTWHTKDEDIVRDALNGRTPGPISSETEQMLKRRGYLTAMSSAEEKDYVERLAGFLHRSAVQSRPPSFLIVPVYQCNLRCPYCFEAYTRIDLRKQALLDKLMTKETADVVFDCMDSIFNNRIKAAGGDPSKAKNRRLTLYGGEPLMGQTRPIIDYLVEQAVDRGYKIGAISNGVELDQFLDLLGPEKIYNIQITLDGPKDQHDCKRIGPSYRGTGTYEKILANSALAVERGSRIVFRFHNDWTNVTRTGEVLEDLEEAGLLDHENFYIYSHPVHNFHRGGAEPEYPYMARHEVDKALDESLCEEHTHKISRSGSSIASKIQTYIDKQMPGIHQSMEPCAATTGMYIFDPLRRIYSCWDTVGIEGKEVGSFSELGPIFNSQASEWVDRSPEKIEECTECKYAFFHFGGCASLPLSAEGSIFKPACYQYQDDFLYAGRKYFARRSAVPKPANRQAAEAVTTTT